MARIAHRQTGLRPGTRYYAYVRGKNTSGRSAWSSVLATTTPGAAATVPPGAVANFRALGASFNSINFNWTPTATATGYDIYITTSPTAPTPGTTPTAQVGAVGTYLHTGAPLRGGVFYHTYIRATNGAGAGPWTVALLVRMPQQVPDVPGNFVSTAGTDNSLTYEWDAAARATGYDIYLTRSTSPPDDTTQPTASVGAVTTYTATGLLGSSTYYAYIRATGRTGASAWSAAVTTQTGLEAPLVPGNLAVTAPTYSTVRAQWSAADRATGYDLYFTTSATAPTAQTTPTVTLGNVTSYTRSGLSASTAYRIYVRASNRAGNSAWSSAVTVTTPAAPVRAPAVPTNLTNTAQTASTLVYTWTASTGATGYDLYISESNVAPTPQTAATASVAAVTTYTFTGLDSSTTFYVYIRAKNAAGNSAWSSAVSAATQSDSVTTSVPNIPADFTNSARAQTTLTYTWTASTGATGYDLFIGTSSDKPAAGATPTASVGAVTTRATELWDQSVNITILNMLFIQGTLSQNVPETGTGRLKVDGTEIGTFDWSELRAKDRFNSGRGATYRESRALAFTAGGVTHYLALPALNRFGYGRSSGTGTYRVEVEADVEQNVTTYQRTGLTSNVTYYAFIRAKNANGASGWSSAVSATTLLVAPGVVAGLAGEVTGTSIAYSWTATARATGYDIYISSSATVPTGGTVPTARVGAVTAYTQTGLTANTTYRAYIRATNNGGRSAWSAVTTNRIAALPAVPANFRRTARTLSSTAISFTLSWNSVAVATSYEIYRSQSTTPPTAQTAASRTQTTRTYSDTQSLGATWYYWVRARNSTGVSAWSSAVVVLRRQLPVAPTDFSGSSSTRNSIVYTWTAATHATGYDLYLATNDVVPTSSTVPTASVGAVTTYTATGLTAGTRYRSYIRAKGNDGISAWTSVLAVTTIAFPPLSGPHNFRATGTSHNTVVFNWDDDPSISRATAYDVYITFSFSTRPTAETTPTATVNSPTRSYTFTGLSANTHYNCFVRSKNSGGAYLWQGPAQTRTQARPGRPPVVPQRFWVAAGDVTTNSIRYRWRRSGQTRVSPRATGYDLYFSTTSTPPVAASTPTISLGNSDEYTRTGLVAGTTHYAWIRSKSSETNGISAWSAVLDWTTSAPAGQSPPVPVNLGSTAITTNSIAYRWAGAGGGNDGRGYDLYISASSTAPTSGTSPTVNIPSSGTTTYTRTGLTAGVTYYAYVRSRIWQNNAIRTSAWSSAYRIGTALPTPTTLSSSSVTPNSIVYTWTATPRATGYDLYFSTALEIPGPSTVPSVSVGNVTTYTRTGLDASITYQAWIRAKNSGGVSDWSARYERATSAVPGTPAAPTPEGLTPSAATATSLTFTWTAVSGATGYDFYIVSSNLLAPRPAASVAPTFSVGNVTTTTRTGLTAGTGYSFYVRAKNSIGTSAWVWWAGTTERAGISAPSVPMVGTFETATSNEFFPQNWGRDFITYGLPYSDSGQANTYFWDLYVTDTATAPTAQTTPTATYYFASGTELATIGLETIRNLSPNTTYRAYLRARNSAGTSAWSSAVVQTTLTS